MVEARRAGRAQGRMIGIVFALAATFRGTNGLLTFPPPPAVAKGPPPTVQGTGDFEQFRVRVGEDVLVQPLTFTVEGASYSTLQLRWSYPREFARRVESYYIECAPYNTGEIGEAEITTASCPAKEKDDICSGTELQFILGGLQGSTEYGCAVQAVGDGATSQPAGPAFGRTVPPQKPRFPSPPPPRQSPPRDLKGNPGNGEVLLTWGEPDNVDRVRILYYTIIIEQRGQGGEFVPDNVLVRGTETSNPPIIAIVSPLQNNVAYEFQVTATSELGESIPSNLLVLTPSSNADIYEVLYGAPVPETSQPPTPSRALPPEPETQGPGTGSGTCQDIAPDLTYTCAEQAFVFYKCGEAFMAESCDYSCGRCTINGKFVNGTTA